jgi:YebC/PmpR family DNA-binding regulatory protein
MQGIGFYVPDKCTHSLRKVKPGSRMNSMSGHSKWSKVKHQKATTDVVKGMAFTKAARNITIAVREGGGLTDPDHNFHLRLAIEKAHDVNMPKENIDRAVEKGKGGESGALEQIAYEAYGPGGAAIIIETTTDNKQRTVSEIKNILEHANGTITSPGAVEFLFERSGILTVSKSGKTYDQVLEAALDAGAQDVIETTDMFELYTSVGSLASVKRQLTEKGIVIDNTEIIMKPKTTIELQPDKQAQNEQIVAQLEALDDVQKVFTNML